MADQTEVPLMIPVLKSDLKILLDLYFDQRSVLTGVSNWMGSSRVNVAEHSPEEKSALSRLLEVCTNEQND